MSSKIELGLGIIGLGRPWGHIPGEVPPESQAIELLECAFNAGIRYFDSAPSYGVAEERLGKFLRSLDPQQRDRLRIASKFGEHWDLAERQPFVDHSYDALRRSVDHSLRHLGRIHVLQLHKTTPAVLRSNDLARAWEYAAQLGITTIGASVSDLESAGIVIAEPRYTCIQLPFNCADSRFAPSIHDAATRKMWVAINRPFAMGAMLYGEHPVSREQAFGFIKRHEFEGVVLTGTKSKRHLEENWCAFHALIG